MLEQYYFLPIRGEKGFDWIYSLRAPERAFDWHRICAKLVRTLRANGDDVFFAQDRDYAGSEGWGWLVGMNMPGNLVHALIPEWADAATHDPEAGLCVKAHPYTVEDFDAHYVRL